MPRMRPIGLKANKTAQNNEPKGTPLEENTGKTSSLSEINTKNAGYVEISDTYTWGDMNFSNKLYVAIKNENTAIFYHPKASGVKQMFEQALANFRVINEEKCCACNFKNVLTIVDKISRKNCDAVFYVLDHSAENVFLSHKKDKLFLAISKKLGEKLKVVIIKDNGADMCIC